MPKKTPDLDFKIHVDESCLSTPMDDSSESHANLESIAIEETAEAEAPLPTSIENEPEADADTPETEIAEVDETVTEPQTTVVDSIEAADLEEEEGQEADEQVESGCTEEEEGTSTNMDYDDAPLISQSKDEVPETPDEITDDDDATPRPSNMMEDGEESAVQERRTSLRTEALIQAAARAVVASIEEQDQEEHDQQEDEGNKSVLTTTTDATDDHVVDDADNEADSHESSRRTSSDSRQLHTPSIPPSESFEGSEAGDSASHQGADEDVFTDRSGRSSLGSSNAADDHMSKVGDSETVQHHDDYSDYRRSPRLSGVSGISNMSQYEEHEEFIPTARGTPRPAFRTPSAVRAMQLSSPPPSVIGSPRSTKRTTGHFPTISRLGSPSVSAQYSPKGRTPPRFKTKKDAPLVLLHVTLLPLRWMWGEVVDALDSTKGHENFEPTDQMKSLRDSWRVLQDRTGDTVLERGILIPHPQSDFEVLEERLLEALELPLRHRARILECGHYLGPSNEMTLAEDDSADSDDEYASQAGAGQKRHWCGVCRCDIRYEGLGLGRIFRVKVYASNGLMKAGAWEACWNQMERVDIEVEPLVESDLQRQLEQLSALQAEQQRQKDAEQYRQELEDEHLPGAEESYVDHPPPERPPEPLQRSPEVLHASPPEPFTISDTDIEAERRRREEERHREIYGETPLPTHQHEPTSSMHPHPDSYHAPPTPPSPSEQAFERREMRRRQAASLPELLLESAQVVFQDPKNVFIALLSVLVLVFAMRTAPQDKETQVLREIYGHHHQMEQQQVVQDRLAEAKVEVTPSIQKPVVEDPAPVVVSISTSVSSPAPVYETVETVQPSAESHIDPCDTSASPEKEALVVAEVLPATVKSVQPEPSVETIIDRKVVRVFETVTETETVKVTATESVQVPMKQDTARGYEPPAAAASAA